MLGGVEIDVVLAVFATGVGGGNQIPVRVEVEDRVGTAVGAIKVKVGFGSGGAGGVGTDGDTGVDPGVGVDDDGIAGSIEFESRVVACAGFDGDRSIVAAGTDRIIAVKVVRIAEGPVFESNHWVTVAIQTDSGVAAGIVGTGDDGGRGIVTAGAVGVVAAGHLEIGVGGVGVGDDGVAGRVKGDRDIVNGTTDG